MGRERVNVDAGGVATPGVLSAATLVDVVIGSLFLRRADTGWAAADLDAR